MRVDNNSTNADPAFMFTAREIKDLMTAQPFKPFRLCLSDGTSHAVPHHDAAFVTRNFVEVGINLDSDGISERVVRCAVLHISKIEDLQPA